VKDVATIPVWAKLTPSTTDIVVEARGAFLGGADAIVSSNTFTSLPLIDMETLDFGVHVDDLVSTGGLGSPAILPLCWRRCPVTQAFPTSASPVSAASTFEHALNYFLLGCGTSRSAPPRCSTTRSGRTSSGPERGLASSRSTRQRLDAQGRLRRPAPRRVVSQSKIRRPDERLSRRCDAEGYLRIRPGIPLIRRRI
jgi:hypothetical protein